MAQDNQARIQRLLDQLEDPRTTQAQVELIEKKLEVLKKLE